MTPWQQDPSPCQWFSRLAAGLDRRSAPRLVLLFFGAVLARGRRTVTRWIRAARLGGQFRPCYTTVAAAGKKADRCRGKYSSLSTRVKSPDISRTDTPSVLCEGGTM
jgi:hypothetical protein